MANIVFCFPPIVSTINSSLLLARRLKARGHQITYLGIADCESVICENGFGFISVYEEWFPRGWFDDVFLKASSPDINLKAAKKLAAHFHGFINYLIAGGSVELERAVQEIKPDMVVISTSGVDSIVWALIFYKMKLKSIYFFSVLGGKFSCNVPPVHTDLAPDGGLWSPIKIMLAWIIYKIKRIKYDMYLIRNGLDLLSSKQIKKIAEYCGYSYANICFWTDMPNPQLKLPELVLCPTAFEFPGSERAGRYYAEASIDLDRAPPSFPWEKIAESQPIVYVALGTLPLLAKSDYEHFFHRVIEASIKWPEWNWVLSIGNNLSVDDFEYAPSNVIVVNRAPQLALLKKSALMITHGGPNSVKECIFFGVPMIVFPLWFDQPGNVARVTYHGLGLKGDFKTTNSKELQALIEEVSTNPKFRERIKAMQKSFMEIEDAKPSIQLIEEFISQSNIPPFLE